MIKRIHVYDCDGILLNSSHRYRTDETGMKIDLAYWIENNTYEKIMQDSDDVLADHYRESLKNPEIFVIIATSRACTENDSNYLAIAEKLGMPNKFVHRKGENDNRRAFDLKVSGIKPILNLKNMKNAVIHVYEDNYENLGKMTLAFRDFGYKSIGHFNPSYQGH